jgi:glycosyltransferase involved in cell wall biosynthesis
MKKLSVIIPSRTRTHQRRFVREAVGSIRDQIPALAQTLELQLSIEIILAVDPGSTLAPYAFHSDIIGKIQIADMASQASALNAGIRGATGDIIAFLEDDDVWAPTFLATALPLLSSYDFISSTQLEVNEAGHVLRINDFPTMSGWLMPRSTLETVGNYFNEEYRYHLDNEWLGRLREANLRRAHLIESTAPVEVRYTSGVRPWLLNVASTGSKLVRHDSAVPLVTRLVHDESAMAGIAGDAERNDRSSKEYDMLMRRFRRIPW